MQPGSQAVPGASFWAFLVGINAYANSGLNSPPLQGCLNDVEAMRAFLTHELQVPEAQIRVLTNKRATRANILQTFQRFLIKNPAIRPGDQILFQFSGHGSQMPNTTGTEPDGYDETIVAYDSRTPGIYDIPDKTLASLLDMLADAKGWHITVVLDCCHSGSGTRALDREFETEGMPGVRWVPPAETPPPDDLDADLKRTGASRSAGPSGWSTEGIPYVLLAACRDEERAFEYAVKVEGQSPIWHGTMTHFLLAQLRHISPHTTYADLHERVAAQVSAMYPTQTPQCEGDRNRVVFGGIRLERHPFIPVRQTQPDQVTLSAGLVHGLRPGTEIAIYPPTTTTLADVTSDPLATASVTSVSLTSAQAVLSQLPAEPIPPHARGIITRQTYIGLRQTVSLQADEQAESQEAIERLLHAILHASPTGAASPYLEVLDYPKHTADLYVKASAGALHIYGAHGQLLVIPALIQFPGPTDVSAVLQTLEFIGRYRTLKALVNEDDSLLAGQIKVRLRKYVPGSKGPASETLPEMARSQGGELIVFYQPEQPEQSCYVVEITNESDMPVYPHVFLLNPDYEVQRFYPRLGEENELRPHHAFLVGLLPPDPLRFELPDGWDMSKDFLKVIVTPDPCDLGMLEQMRLQVPPPLRGGRRSSPSAFELLLEAIMTQTGTRHMSRGPAIREAWATAELSITTVRLSQSITLDSTNNRLALAPGVFLTKPAELVGRVGLFTLNQAAHALLESRTPKIPSGLRRFPDVFTPVLPPEIQAVDRSPLALRLEVDVPACQQVTPEHPLEITLGEQSAQDAVDLFPIVYDGEDYLPAGYRDELHNTIKLVELPAPAPHKKHQSLWIMAYQRRRPQAPDGLSEARLMRGRVIYTPLQKQRVPSGQSVALFLHGLTAGTTPLIKPLLPFLHQQVHHYDHVLAWNYSGLWPNLEEQEIHLSQVLQEQCGLGPGDGVRLDVYAHGFGCLIARYLVEEAGENQYVDRLILAGPPYQGSPLLQHPAGLRYLFAASLNGLVSPLNGFAHEWYDQSTRVISGTALSVLERWKQFDQATRVPYLVLAGNVLPPPSRMKRLNRLAQKVLHQATDMLFQEPNDLVLGFGSIAVEPLDASPGGKVVSLDCDHFHYFDSAAGKEAIKHWMREGSPS